MQRSLKKKDNLKKMKKSILEHNHILSQIDFQKKIDMKEKNLTIFLMEMDQCFMQMEIFIEESGYMEKNKVVDYKYINNWECNTKESGKTISLQEVVNYYSPITLITLVNSKMVKSMAEVNFTII